MTCRRRAVTAAICLLSVTMTVACGGGRNRSPAGDPIYNTTTPSEAPAGHTGDEDFRLAGRDRSPLPVGTFLRFQSISTTPDPRTNHRWVLAEDGRLFVAFHSRDTAGAVPFDTPLPDRPTRVLPGTDVQEVRSLVRDQLFDLPPVVRGAPAEGGMWQVVTARIDGREHEVVFDRARHPLADRLQKVASGG